MARDDLAAVAAEADRIEIVLERAMKVVEDEGVSAGAEVEPVLEIEIEVVPGAPHGEEHGLPEGAMYIFCSCAGTIGKRAPDGRVIENDTDFTMYLLDSVGVAVVQGVAYGLSPYFRASFVAPEADLVLGGDLIQQACAALR